MRKIILASIVSICILGCNDGDVIVTSFDFSAAQLQECSGDTSFLFFRLNEANVESISLRLSIDETLFEESQEQSFVLDGTTNFVNYRIFDGEVDASYFCTEIPPTSPNVLTEFIGASGIADVSVLTVVIDTDTLEEDPESNEDTDKDGLLNFFDFDDDGDNVPTIQELDIANEDGDNNPLTNPLDTDGDKIPDYLDDDDDGDGILTRYEDIDGDLDPTNDFTDPTQTTPNYLDINSNTESNIIDIYREHNFNFSSDLDIVIRNLVLLSNEEQISLETFDMGSIINILVGNQTITPPFN